MLSYLVNGITLLHLRCEREFACAYTLYDATRWFQLSTESLIHVQILCVNYAS